MNWVDLLIVLVLAFYAYRGWRGGFLRIALGYVGLVVSIGLAILLYKPVIPAMQGLGMPYGIAKAAAFLLLWLLGQIAFFLVTFRWYRRLPRSVHSSGMNRAAGIVPALVEGLIMVALAAMLVVVLPIPALPREDVLNSTIASPLIHQAAAIERHAANILGAAVQDLMTFITVKPEPTSTERRTLPYRTTNVSVDTSAEQTMLELVNRERIKHGLPPLTQDPALQKVARAHSRDMFAKGYFSHVNLDGKTPFDRMRSAGIGYREAGENLALSPTVEIAHNGLMDSPGHRANILSPHFRRVGIGAVTNDVYGTMFTQNFRN